MTEPDGKPRRRRRRPQRQAGAGPADPAAGPKQGTADETPLSKDEVGAPDRPNEPSDSAKSEPDGDSAKAHREGDSAKVHQEKPAKAHRDGEQGRGHGRDSERGWRELAGSSPSQVGLSGALRARDVARPTADDLAAAERSVTVVRRHWQPPES